MFSWRKKRKRIKTKWKKEGKGEKRKDGKENGRVGGM